jgi:hypothetical protein
LAEFLHFFKLGGALADAVIESVPFELQLTVGKHEALAGAPAGPSQADNDRADEEKSEPTGDFVRALQRNHVGCRQYEELSGQAGKNRSDDCRTDAPLQGDKHHGGIERDIGLFRAEERPKKNV